MTSTISRDELKAGLDAGTITVVDAPPESYYAQQQLPGALNLLTDDVGDRAAKLLPDKDVAIVTYCSNPACQDSTRCAYCGASTTAGFRRSRRVYSQQRCRRPSSASSQCRAFLARGQPPGLR